MESPGTHLRNEPSPRAEPACPVCGVFATDWMTVPGDWRRPQLDARYDLRWCDGCEHGFLHPPPSLEDTIAAHYLDEYFTHGAFAPEARRGTVLHRLESKVRGHVAWRLDQGGETRHNFAAVLGEPKRVCEIGCGTGELGEFLASRGHSYVGIEIDGAARALAKERGLEVHEGVAQEVPGELADRRFDTVVMSHVLEHVADLQAAMRTITALLDEGGVFVAEVPNNEAVDSGELGATWYWLDVPRHVQFFTGASLSRLCNEQGLRTRALEYTGFVRHYQDQWLDQEKRIHDFMASRGWNGPRSGRRRAWRRLLRQAFLPDAKRYDSVMVVADREA